MREWLMRPEHLLASVVWGPMLVLLALYVWFGARDFGRRVPLTHMLRWLLPVGWAVVAYWGWLFEREPLRVVGDLLIFGVAGSIWAFALSHAIAAAARSRDDRSRNA